MTRFLVALAAVLTLTACAPPLPRTPLFMTVDIRFHDWGRSRTISAPAGYTDVE